MCPFWDYDNKRCKVSPSDSQCYNSESEQKAYGCMSDYDFKSSCANYAAYQRGDYKVERRSSIGMFVALNQYLLPILNKMLKKGLTINGSSREFSHVQGIV